MLERLAVGRDVAAAVERLVRLGVLTVDMQAGIVRVARMHRLVGAAIRADLERPDPPPAERVVLAIATNPDARALLDTDGDLATLRQLAERAVELDVRSAESHELGVALCGIAELYELHGHTQLSGDLYARAERHLQDDPVLLAQSFHGRARTINQHVGKFPTREEREERLREALGWARTAQTLLKNTERPENADRSRAMEGLLLQKLADFPREGEQTLALLRAARDVIEEAHARRSSRLSEQDPELARSEFNRAGIRVRLARKEVNLASDHLQSAEQVYESVGRLRRAIYGRDQHPHIAACVIGLAYVQYYRALLIPAAADERARLLREATARTLEATEMREAQEGSIDGDEVAKCTRFLAKVALARDALVVAQHARTAEHFAEPLRGRAEVAWREVSDARFVLASTPSLPSHPADAGPAIDAWARSPAIAELVAAFAPEARPPFDADLAELLDWLEQLSARWDLREGRERNLVDDQQTDEPVGRMIQAAAHGLGLVGTLPPPARRYDHVLILGGLIRACFARPRHAAALLRERGVEAGAVTALGGYRELRGDELELAARFGMPDLADEFDAMHAGVRAAFELGEPIAERGERSDVLGASWRVVEYETVEDVALHVVAAPSSDPGERRANTADTYAWWAAELARLRRGQRILIVTTDIYVPYQHADALRMLGLRYDVEVDAVGIRPGDVDPRLQQEFLPHNYLQEIRSTIRAYRMLHETAASGVGH